MDDEQRLELRVIGVVRSPLRDPADAPRQGDEGAPRAQVVLDPQVWPGLDGLPGGEELLVVTCCAVPGGTCCGPDPATIPTARNKGCSPPGRPTVRTRWGCTVCGSLPSMATRWRSTGWKRSTALLSST